MAITALSVLTITGLQAKEINSKPDFLRNLPDRFKGLSIRDEPVKSFLTEGLMIKDPSNVIRTREPNPQKHQNSQKSRLACIFANSGQVSSKYNAGLIGALEVMDSNDLHYPTTVKNYNGSFEEFHALLMKNYGIDDPKELQGATSIEINQLLLDLKILNGYMAGTKDLDLKYSDIVNLGQMNEFGILLYDPLSEYLQEQKQRYVWCYDLQNISHEYREYGKKYFGYLYYSNRFSRTSIVKSSLERRVTGHVYGAYNTQNAKKLLSHWKYKRKLSTFTKLHLTRRAVSWSRKCK